MANHNDEALVTFARGALEAIGIPALVPGESSGAIQGFYVGRATRAELQVFESDRDRASVELRRMRIRIVPPERRA
jgi:hypothetical protein